MRAQQRVSTMTIRAVQEIVEIDVLTRLVKVEELNSYTTILARAKQVVPGVLRDSTLLAPSKLNPVGHLVWLVGPIPGRPVEDIGLTSRGLTVVTCTITTGISFITPFSGTYLTGFPSTVFKEGVVVKVVSSVETASSCKVVTSSVFVTLCLRSGVTFHDLRSANSVCPPMLKAPD
nr:hypothetical protein HmN_000933400 [Hymenolepis microstoma]